MPAIPEELIRIFWIICGGLTALSIAAYIVFMILSYVKNKKRAAASPSWFTTHGTILKSSMDQSNIPQRYDYYSLREGKFIRSHDCDPITYYVKVSFAYQVMGQDYRGRHIFAGDIYSLLQSEAQAILARYPEGAAVTVYYDPDNPADGFLERPTPPSTTPLYLGIIVLGFALCMIISGFVVFYTFGAMTGG